MARSWQRGMSVVIGAGLAVALLAGAQVGPTASAPSRPTAAAALLMDSPTPGEVPSPEPTDCEWTGDDPGPCPAVHLPSACPADSGSPSPDASDQPCLFMVEQAEMVDCPGPPECSAGAGDPSPSPTTFEAFAAMADRPLCDARPGPGRCRLYEYTKEPRVRIPRSGDSLIVDVSMSDPGLFTDEFQPLIDEAARGGSTLTRLWVLCTVLRVQTYNVFGSINVDWVVVELNQIHLDSRFGDFQSQFTRSFGDPRQLTLVIVDR